VQSVHVLKKPEGWWPVEGTSYLGRPNSNMAVFFLSAVRGADRAASVTAIAVLIVAVLQINGRGCRCRVVPEILPATFFIFAQAE
jgi:hypothetical protein